MNAKAISLHRKAMELAEEAMLRKLKGETSAELLRSALEAEKSAALQFAQSSGPEPTRSILFRSAASLALECQEIREAERLIARGLAGDPPSDIATELRDLLEEVYFQRHLELRGVELGADEVQMTLTGNVVGLGVAQSKQVLDRIDRFEKLARRTGERLSGEPYKEGGPPKRALKESLECYISQPRAASYAVTLKLGSKTQREIPGVGLAENVLEEMLDLLELFEDAEAGKLRERIPDEAYLRNFVSLARKLAPDGKKVKTIGFTSTRSGKERRVLLKRKSSDLPEEEFLPTSSQQTQRKSVTLSGTLLFADEVGNRNEIKLVDERGKKLRVEVPEGMMADIVRPMWGEQVIVRGWEEGAVVRLEEIDLDEE